jgi:hypothetical protein
MDKSTAIKVAEHFDAMIAHANEVLYLVNNNCSREDRDCYQKVLGTVVTELDLELLEPIYKAFPDLRPKDMEELR